MVMGGDARGITTMAGGLVFISLNFQAKPNNFNVSFLIKVNVCTFVGRCEVGAGEYT